jgi:hypothetical protein
MPIPIPMLFQDKMSWLNFLNNLDTFFLFWLEKVKLQDFVQCALFKSMSDKLWGHWGV